MAQIGKETAIDLVHSQTKGLSCDPSDPTIKLKLRRRDTTFTYDEYIYIYIYYIYDIYIICIHNLLW